MNYYKEFTLRVGYQKDTKYRSAFNHLAIKIFGLSFETWYQAGYWKEKYIPYTLFDGDKAIANVSANIMDFVLLGVDQRYIQIGTVMTDEAYRNKGLSRFLMEKVVDEWNNKCEFIYLFANSTVWNFYPKLGFSRVKEFEYFKPLKKKGPADYEKLNMDDQTIQDMLYHYAKRSCVFGKLSMHENADLVMFYCITVFKENVYYIQSLDTIVVAKFDNKQLLLLDVFSKVKVDLEKVIVTLASDNIDSILLGFTPKDTSTYEMRSVDETVKDEVLFIQNSKTELFDKNQLMFPLLSHT